MDPTFIQWLIGQAGVAGLAAMSVYLLNRSYEDAKAREKEFSDNNRADKLQLIAVLQETTKALNNLENAVETLIRDSKQSSR